MLAELHVCITTSDQCSQSTSIWSTLLPVVVGAVLGYGATFLGSASQRRSQRERDEYVRQSLVVQPLDAALVETQVRIEGTIPPGESRWEAAHRAWENGWVRLTPHLDDEELEERYRAVGTILMELIDRENDDDVKIGPMRRVAMRAIANARISLAAWLRGDELPPRSFPTSQETIDLLGQGDPTPLAPQSPLRTWLDEHPQPPWRSPRPEPWWHWRRSS